MFGMVETVAPASFTIDCSLTGGGDMERDTEEVERADTRGRRGSVFV